MLGHIATAFTVAQMALDARISACADQLKGACWDITSWNLARVRLLRATVDRKTQVGHVDGVPAVAHPKEKIFRLDIPVKVLV
jgi:hypothetical protein